MKYTVKKYEESDATAWDVFIDTSKNGTFLHTRSFLNYHGNRFQDHSLLVFKKSILIGVFPAHISNQAIYSHNGLTYGGLVLAKNISLHDVLNAFQVILQYYSGKGYQDLFYKSIPPFYHKQAAYEEQYIFFLVNALNYRTDTSFVVDLSQENVFQKRRKRMIKKALKQEVKIETTNDLSAFWNEILTPNLLERFGTSPVHNLEEIKLLQEKFPKNIIQVNAHLDNEIIAGATIFLCDGVAHAQYISANQTGRSTGAIDYLFSEMITKIFKTKEYFSFGIANENQGRALNKGLMEWKEGFSTTVFPNQFWQINCADHSKLANLLAVNTVSSDA